MAKLNSLFRCANAFVYRAHQRAAACCVGNMKKASIGMGWTEHRL